MKKNLIENDFSGIHSLEITLIRIHLVENILKNISVSINIEDTLCALTLSALNTTEVRQLRSSRKMFRFGSPTSQCRPVASRAGIE